MDKEVQFWKQFFLNVETLGRDTEIIAVLPLNTSASTSVTGIPSTSETFNSVAVPS